MEVSKLLSAQTSTHSVSEYDKPFQKGIYESILPILDSLSQLYLPFQFFEFIQIFFCVLQICEASFWAANGSYWKKTKLANILHYIAFFSSINRSPKENIILFFIFFALVLIIFILFFVLIYHYHKSRRLYYPLLYIIRIYFMFFGVVILHPISSLMGHLFNDVIENKSTIDIIMLVFTAITFVGAEILYYIFQRFINEGIYMHKSLFVTFDSTLLLFFYIWNPFFLFLGHLFKYYPNWSYYILICIHIFLIIMSLLNYIWLPFIMNFGNSLAISTFCEIIFIDIFRIFAEFFQFRQEIFLGGSLFMFVVFTITAFFVVKYVKRRIYLKLFYASVIDTSQQLEPTIEQKFVYFSDLKLEQNMKKAMIYLIVGFTTGSDLFVDFSLPKYCFEFYQETPQMVVFIVHLLSYFKSGKTLFDCALKKVHSLRHISFFEQFIYYQAHRIKIFRQFTSTKFSSSRLSELKQLSNELEGQVKAFWSLQTASKNTLAQLEQKQRNLINFWEESIDYNWLSAAFRESHIRFLIESCTDFRCAVQMEITKEKIDSAKVDRDDLCFLSLILCIPRYLFRKILDRKGEIVMKKQNHSTTTTSTVSSHNDKYSTTSSDLEFNQEDHIANSLFTHGRLRLSVQNTLSSFKPALSKFLSIYSIILLVISLICIMTIFAIYVNRFDNFNNWDEEVGVLSSLRLGYVRSFFCLSVFYGQKTGRFKIKPIRCRKMNEQNRAFLELDSDFSELAKYHISNAKIHFANLIKISSDLALQNVDTTALTSFLFDPLINTSFCFDGEIIDQTYWPMEKILNFEIFSFSILAEEEIDNVEEWYHNNSYWCHVEISFPYVQNMFINIQNALTDDLYEISVQTSKSIVIQMIIIGSIIFLLFIIIFPLILYFYSKEINNLIKMILSSDEEYKEQARKSISLKYVSETNEMTLPMANRSFNFINMVFLLFATITLIGFIVFNELILYYSKLMSERLRYIGVWSCNFSLLRAFLMEIIIELINAVYYADISNEYLSNSMLKEQIYGIVDSFEIIIHDIMNDSPGNPSSVGVDPIIDEIVLTDSCLKPEIVTNLHDTYKCGSLSQVVSAIHAIIVKICEGIDSYNGIFDGEEMQNIYHITFAHAITDLIDVDERYKALQDEEINAYKINLTIFFICGIVSLFVCSIFISMILLNFQRVLKMALSLIRRLPPNGLINNRELTNYLLYKKREEIEMGVTHTIFNNSFDGIICMNHDGVVEIINKSFTNDYGYSTEQLVGQQVGLIFDNESRIKVENQLKLMKNHESRDYVDHVICLTNDGRAIQTFITLFITKESENNFILVVHDETLLQEKKKRLEMAKKQSQDLLEQIMPPKVLMMLKQGKSEISFSVPSATVMFVDIVNFSGFSQNLSPQQTMGTLSTLFGAFDVFIQKFPLMTKIKLIGDNYMAACGLFAAEDEKKTHAQQTIDFSLCVLSIVDDTNMKLNIELQVRIGVNTDGPLIAGVLGTENRVFDIIGDTINVASRLEHKAEPGHILMSEKTFILVNDIGYIITPIGEVFLKGKGNMKAYSL